MRSSAKVKTASEKKHGLFPKPLCQTWEQFERILYCLFVNSRITRKSNHRNKK